MVSDPKRNDSLDLLTEQLRLAPALTPALMLDVVAKACVRLSALTQAGKTARFFRLIEDDAWSDAALALIELEAPAWTLRRLICEDGEWLCSLTEQPYSPIAVDDTADASHSVLPLAILLAFLETRQRVAAAREARRPAEPQARAATAYVACCDNFA